MTFSTVFFWLCTLSPSHSISLSLSLIFDQIAVSFFVGMLSHNYPHPVYIGGSIVGHHGTLRRPREYEHTPPRILSKIDADQQFYYGWHLMNAKDHQQQQQQQHHPLQQPPFNPHQTQLHSQRPSPSPSPLNATPADPHNNPTITLCPPGRTYCF